MPGVYLDLISDRTTSHLGLQRATARPPIDGVELSNYETCNIKTNAYKRRPSVSHIDIDYIWRWERLRYSHDVARCDLR